MSILVKGIDMPKCCNDCPLFDESYLYCNAYSYGRTDRTISNPSTIPGWCGLIEVPDCHGDLIDRSVVLDSLRMGLSGTGCQSVAMHFVESEKYAPTVIEGNQER